MSDSTMPSPLHQALVGGCTLLIALVMAYGALAIPAEAGYAGVGPNALPWAVSAVLALCGGWLIWEARSGGFRQMDAPSGAARADWRAGLWVVGAVIIGASLLTRIGFVLACTLCFACAVRGLRMAEGRPGGDARLALMDLLTGILIAAPVFWLFNKLLNLNLPAIVLGGWI